MPLPNDFSTVGGQRFDFKNAIRPQPFLPNLLRIATEGNSLLPGFPLPSENENVAVRQRAHIVVMEATFVGHMELPQKVASPREESQASTLTTSMEDRGVVDPGGSQKASILE